jgi:hypothetical protein
MNRPGFTYLTFKSIAMAAAFLLLALRVHAITYYSRSSGANWSTNASWSTVTYGGPAATNHPVAGDTVYIANGITVFVNTTSACSEINIGQGTSGILQFASTGSFTLTVSGNITVNNGAQLYYNSNATRTHTLKIGGNLLNYGTVDLVYDANDRVNIFFDGTLNSMVSGSGGWSLNTVTLNKTSAAASLEVKSTTFEAAINSLITTTGTYVHNNSSIYAINAAAAANYTITSSVVFYVPQGTLKFSPNNNMLYLEGQLYINGGNVYVGSTTGTGGLIYRQPASFIPYLEITSGFLDVYGGIYNNLNDPFSFKMTGGTILLNNGSTGTQQGVFFQNDLAGSVFYMSGGTIILEKHNLPGGINNDWAICGNAGTVTVTGGTVQFGDNSTLTGTTFDFAPFAGVVQPNIKVTGASGAAITLATSKSSTSDFILMSLYIDVNKTFDIRSIQGVSGDSKNMTITSTYDGTNAFYNSGTFLARTGTVTFSGTTSQAMSGSTVSAFYNLTINSSNDVTLSTTENVSSLLTMSLGNLNTTSSNMIVCTSTANATMGSASSYVDGPMKHTVANAALTSRNFPIGKGSSYRPAVLSVKHSNGTSVTYIGEVINASADALGYTIPSSLATVSTVRYWNFTRQNVSNFTNATMKLYYDVDDNVTNRLSVSVIHDDGSSNWLDMGGTGTADNTGSITSTTITSFKSKFSFGFPPGGLPIKLVSFDAKKSGHQVMCSWVTSSEINNDYFTIERSADGIKYDSVLAIKGAGNSSNELHYACSDKNPLLGNSYYRLKQTNYDGSSSWSDAVHMYIEKISSSYAIFPNPSDGGFVHISRNGEDMSNAKIIVRNILGKEVPVKSQFTDDKKEINFSTDSFSTDDMYFISVLNGSDCVKEKILIHKR